MITTSGSSVGVCDVAYVLDAAGFFAGFQLSAPEEVYTVPDVIKEVRDSDSRRYLGLGISAGKVLVKEPCHESIKFVETLASELGELGRLSGTDIKLLALVKELVSSCHEVFMVSDDRSVQNVALALGARVQGVKRRALKRPRKYVYLCPSCGRVFNGPGTCPVCGVRLVRVKRDKAFRNDG